MRLFLALAVFAVLASAQTPRDYIAALTGDVTAGPGPTAAATLATVNSAPGSCGNATHVCVITVDAKGRVTAQSSTLITGGGGGGVWGSITGTLSSQTDLETALSGKQATGNYITALTGDVTASGAGSDAATLKTVNGSPGTCGDAAHVCQVTTNAKGLVTSQLGVAISSGSGLADPGSNGIVERTSAGVTTAVAAPTGIVVGTSDTQTLTNKSIAASEINSGTLAAAQMPGLTGDVTSSAGAVATTLATVNTGPGSCGDATHTCQVTTNGKGLVTSQTPVLITGTGGMTNPMTTAGDMIVGGASGVPTRLAKGTDTYVLTMLSGSPAWQPAGSGSGGTATAFASGTLSAIPATCAAGDVYFATDQPALQQEYQCSATDVWTQMLNLGASGGLAVTGGSLDIVTAVVPTKAGTNAYTGANSFSESIVHGVNTVGYSATPNFDMSAGDLQTITLTGNVTGATFSNLSAGTSVKLQVCQDSTGSRTFAWSGSTVHGFSIGSTASKCSLVALDSFDGSNLYSEGVQNQ